MLSLGGAEVESNVAGNNLRTAEGESTTSEVDPSGTTKIGRLDEPLAVADSVERNARNLVGDNLSARMNINRR